jgi:transposase
LAIWLKALLSDKMKYGITTRCQSQHQMESNVFDYIGLDVSLEETAVSIRRDGVRVWRGKCKSDPQVVAEVIRRRAPFAKKVVFETGPLSIWFFHALLAEGLPAICIDARHAKAALGLAANKTDANDADGLAHLAEVGFYKEVRVKGFDSMLTRTLITGRTKLLKICTELSNQIRGLMKTFGLIVPKGIGGKFDHKVRDLLDGNDALSNIILPILEAWNTMRKQTAVLTFQLIKAARANKSCELLMSVPGVGVVVATSFLAAIEGPENFKYSRSVGAWLGLTTRRYQSGEVDYDGHISRRGDNRLRGLLYEAAVANLTRTHSENGLKSWGKNLREKIGFKRAVVAMARKMAVIMHAMLKTGELFDPKRGLPKKTAAMTQAIATA